LFFAVHPVNVESVAWVAQRKTLFITMFFRSAIYRYLRYMALKKTGIYVRRTMGLYTLGFMGRPSNIVLPFKSQRLSCQE